MTDTAVSIIYIKEMRRLINLLKNYGLNSNGIIFGGLVRDEIIGTYYRKKFIDKKETDINKYWKYNYDHDTRYRLILPNDMDIYFKNNRDSDEFIDKITSFVNLYNGQIMITDCNNSIINNFKYTNECLNTNFKHRKITIIFFIGRTFTFRGVKTEFIIDVINGERTIIDTSRPQYNIDNIEPPFYNLDFLCNVFIMEKINGNIVTRMSNCTGTPIDDMIFSNKSKVANDIINDIVMFKTKFTRNINHIDTEFINCYRILKMITRANKFNWNITNLPFTIFIKEYAPYDIDTTCSICLENIKINDENKNDNYRNDNYVYIASDCKRTNNVLHYSCFINYLKNEQKKKYRNPETRYIECRCPFRNPFNFKDCHKLIIF